MTSADLSGSSNPNGIPTTYRFEYLTEAIYEANIDAARELFPGADFAPTGGAGQVGSNSSPDPVAQHLAGLLPATAYRSTTRRRACSRYPGIALVASIPPATGRAGYVTRLGRSFRSHGVSHSYLTAGCPAPAGVTSAIFPFARAVMSFRKGPTIVTTLDRTCRAKH